MISKIESVQNEKIKAAVKLARSADARASQGLFFLEGLRLCADLLNSSLSVETVFFTADCMQRHGEQLGLLLERAAHACEISAAVAEKLSQTKTPQGVFCLVSSLRLKDAAALDPACKYIALERIQDPSNLGAVCRTAEALGIDGAVLCGCCDAMNPKTLRASMGSLFRLPLFSCEDLPALLQQKKAQGMRVFATTPDESAAQITHCAWSKGVIAVIGNEANGVTAQTREVCEAVTIPMRGRAESLNASMAAAIVMWEMIRPEPEGGSI